MDYFLNDSPLLRALMSFIQQLRDNTGLSIRQLCHSSHVGTSTYCKMMKIRVVKADCYIRILIGLCYVSSHEDFKEAWGKLGDTIYDELTRF